jgi:hypothetical protein
MHLGRSVLLAVSALAGVGLWSSGTLGDVGRGLDLLTSAHAWQLGLDQQIAARGITGAALLTPATFEVHPALSETPVSSAVFIVSGGCRAKSGWGIFDVETDLCQRLGGSEIQL